MEDIQHQTLSPVAGIVEMITMFNLGYMHLCCLGVTRKLVNMWMKVPAAVQPDCRGTFSKVERTGNLHTNRV